MIHRNVRGIVCVCTFVMVLLSGVVFNIFSLPVTEKAGKIFHLGSPVDLDGKEFMVTGEIVALSEKIKMQSGDIQVISPSIFFIIDHSGSMYWDQNNCRRDSLGHRFTVTDKIIEMMANNPSDYPGVECGVSIFSGSLFYEGDTDPLVLDTLPDSLNTSMGSDLTSGAYLPLFKLDQEYDTKDGSMKGSEILRKYLETELIDTSSNGYRFRIPTAPRDDNMDDGTNISYGFRAAVNAMKDASTGKDNHYIIFISDGQSSAGWRDYENGYVIDADYSDTNNIPTTFTIFFPIDSAGSHPNSLDDMNDGIKNNDYSKSNAKYTQLWDFMNSTEDELLQFVKDSIISVIVKKQVWKNLQIDGVNGLGVWNEQTQVFDLPSVIPLTGKTTEFDYTITYEIDTVSRQNDIDTVKIGFKMTVDHNLTQNDTIFEVTHWERTLGFYDMNNNGLDSIHGAVDQFMINFENDPLTAGYQYSEAEVEIRTVNGGDKETYTLQEISPQKFTVLVQPEATSALGTPGDGTLEYKLHDTFIATFRNSEDPVLPLDTLTTSITVNSDMLELTKGIYFDNDADGEIDSIFVAIAGECTFTDDDVTLIADNIELPEHREFTLVDAYGHDDGVSLIVSQASEIHTAVSSSDKLELAETIVLSDNGTISEGTVLVVDSVAPVIMSASLVDYLDGSGEDILSVTFSENVTDPEKEKPFSFYSIRDDKVYSAKLKLVSVDGDKCEFDVTSVEGVSFIEEGDSIRINWVYDDNIVDKVSNNQDNPINIRREITVKAVTAFIRSAYYDDDADGHVDRMTVTVPKYDYSDKVVKKLVERISFPDYRCMLLDEYQEEDGIISLAVYDTTDKISASDICYTSCNADDKLEIKSDVSLGDNVVLGPCSVAIHDSVAPVIMSAVLVDSLKPGSRDELTVIFSEGVDAINKEMPFELYSIRNKKVYWARLKNLDQNGVTGFFEVKSLTGAMARIDIGDSIRIHKDGDVFDSKENEQANGKNVRRQIAVKRIPIPFDVEIFSEIKTPDMKFMVIKVKPIKIDGITEFDSLSAVFSIYDPVANTVRSELEMDFKQNNDLIYLQYKWDCRNEAGREVGPGSYLALFTIRCHYVEDNGKITQLNKHIKRHFLAVQK